MIDPTIKVMATTAMSGATGRTRRLAAGKPPLEDSAGHDRHDHHLHRIEKEVTRRHVDTSSGERGGQTRRHQHSKQRRGDGHRYRQGNVGAGQKRNHVRCGATRATRHQDEPDRKGRREIEDLGQAPPKRGHQRILKCYAWEHTAPLTPDPAKILESNRHAHAEHDDGEPDRDQRSAEPCKEPGPNEGEAAGHQDPKRERVGQRRDYLQGGQIVYGGQTMVFQPDVLKGKAALVTGGGTGICRGIALELADHGCDVAITSRSLEHLEPTVEEIRSRGRTAVAVTADVRDPAAVDDVVARTVETFGRLDIVVNGAAGNFLCLAEDLSPNGFGAVVDIDLKGTFHVSKATLPHLKAHGGTILNISATLHYLGSAAQLHVSPRPRRGWTH